MKVTENKLSNKKAPKLGIYEHFKGKRYEVLGVARHSETLEKFVVYRALYGKYVLWVRPIEMFLAKTILRSKDCLPEHSHGECFREKVEFKGKIVSRFRYVGK